MVEAKPVGIVVISSDVSDDGAGMMQDISDGESTASRQ
jgi:hypothetical protein